MERLAGKRILFVITKSNWGGAQLYVYTLATALASAGAAVAVALGGTGDRGAESGLLEQKLTAAGIHTIFLKSFTREVSTNDLAALGELRAVLRKERPDILHVNSSKAGGLGAFAGRLAGVRKIVFTAHGWPHQENRSVAARAGIWLASWMTALLSHDVIVVSKNDLHIGMRMPFCRDKIHLIYNGIELTMPLGSGESIRRAFATGVRITGTIGELTRNKNQIALIEEARENPQMYVAIIGEGEERSHLQAKIQEYGLETRVRLFGFIPAREVLRGFDVFALPSLKEGLPYVLLEARMAGLPIIANRVGGVGEILDAKDMSSFSLGEMVAKTVAVYTS